MQVKPVLFDHYGSGGSGAAPSAAEVLATDSGGAEEKGRGEGGNMWPTEETVALLNVRSKMDREFRETALNGLLWDEVSRKLGELGYTRSGKKCREKFENLNGYNKRTKDGQSGRLDGENYKFCEHIDSFGNERSVSLSPSDQRCIIQKENLVEPTVDQIDSASYGFIVPTPTPTTSSSEKDSEGSDAKGWKMADYFEKLMNKVLEKQESLQKQLLDTMEKCEKDRIAREEAWRRQYIERVKKEQELLANARAIASAKDAALMELLHKFLNHEIPRDTPFPKPSYTNEQNLEILTSLAADDGPTEHEISLQFLNPLIPASNTDKQHSSLDMVVYKPGNGVAESYNQSNTSRWPKEEVETLIRIRHKLAEDGLRGPVWDEVSSSMKKFGYDRQAKRCREKWDNINKYYRRVKESHKRKPGSSKTCPYFNLLDSIYEKKFAKVDDTLDLCGTNQRPEDILLQQQQQQQNSIK